MGAHGLGSDRSPLWKLPGARTFYRRILELLRLKVCATLYYGRSLEYRLTNRPSYQFDPE